MEEFEFKPLSEGLGFHRTQKEPMAPQKPIERPSTKTIDDILQTLNYKKQYDFAEEIKQVPTESYKASGWELAAGLLDLMLIVAAQLTCLIILLLTTKIDLLANITQPDDQLMIYASLLMLFAGISWIYLVANRIFLGFTPGEWVFDQRLGEPAEMGKASYSLKVAVRSTFVILTGFFLFPLVSAILNRDILGRMMGLELVKKA